MTDKAFLAALAFQGASLVRAGSKGLGYFEDFTQNFPRRSNDMNQAQLDLRVAKAFGTKGYNKLRISVVAAPNASFPDFDFDYQKDFQYRWRAAFDLGKANTTCGDGVYARGIKVEAEPDCMLECTDDDKCWHYTYYADSATCDLASSCSYQTGGPGDSYRKYHTNRLFSSVVEAKPGLNTWSIGNQTVEVLLPEENEGVKGVIWSDPCISGRFVGCNYGDSWSTFERGAEMMNALAKDKNMSFFQILGDNFYDQDGRLTRAMFDAFSLDVKSKILMAVAGNHDLWVCGVPSCGDKYDQSGYGMMQFYGQDPLASTLKPQSGKSFLNFDVDPDKASSQNQFNNDHTNFLWYHKVGNLGFMGYNGAATEKDTAAELKQACAYFKETQPAAVVLLGHWDNKGMGCGEGNDVPEVAKILRDFEGCDIGDKLKYFDGHKHCNHVQEQGEKEPVGFMIGGHGMHGCGQYGFNYVDSTGGKLKVYYFEERNDHKDNYQAILDCVNQNGGDASKCTHLAALWVESDL